MTQWYHHTLKLLSSFHSLFLKACASDHLCSVCPLTIKRWLSQIRWYSLITTSKYRKIVSFCRTFICLFQLKKKLSQWPGLSDILIAYKEIALAISGMFSSYSRRQFASEDKFEKRSGFRWKTISVYHRSVWIWFHKCGMKEISHFIILFKSIFIWFLVPILLCIRGNSIVYNFGSPWCKVPVIKFDAKASSKTCNQQSTLVSTEVPIIAMHTESSGLMCHSQLRYVNW